MSSQNVNYAGDSYSKFRPTYSEEIFSLIYQVHVNNHGEFQLAADIGCGTGQVSTELAKKFDQVYGIDTLPEQINNAKAKDNIIYQVGPAEDLSQFEDHSVDMVTVGTAFHWFNHDQFLKEAKRVLKRNTGTLAVFSYTYPVLKNEPQANEIVKALVAEFDKYSNSNITYIKNLYRDIKFPFEHQKWYITPESEDITHISGRTQGSLMEASMTIERFRHYMKTASSYYNYIEDEENQVKGDPVDNMIPVLMNVLNTTDINHVITLEWPTVLVLAQTNT
jgi:ubiquinone/menaquinone biosynthesis C-methylase UbiE